MNDKKKAAEASEGLHRQARENERKTEKQMGKGLKKGPHRFEERSRSSDGKSAEDKQNL